MNSSAHRKELGQFLKARRAELSPRTVGLPETDRRRRVAGLRRDEVAVLAAISTDYYTRLEQGRLLNELSVAPGMILGRHLDILAWNPMAAALFGTDFGVRPPGRR